MTKVEQFVRLIASCKMQDEYLNLRLTNLSLTNMLDKSKNRTAQALANTRWKRPDARSAASERMRAYWAGLTPEQLAEKHAHLKRIAQQRRKPTADVFPPVPKPV